jgi:hypothetical protein
MPRLDDKRPARTRMQFLHAITLFEARVHGFGNATSSQTRQITVYVLDVFASQFLYKIVTSGYFSYGTDLYQHLKQTMTSLVNVGYLHRQYAIVFVNMEYVPDDLICWCCPKTSTSSSKGEMM